MDRTAVQQAPMRVAILGSGQGSTTHSVLAYEASHQPGTCPFQVCRVISSKAGAGILQIAQDAGVGTSVVPYDPPDTFATRLMAVLEEANADLLVLAGFLRLLPSDVIRAMGGRVINTHPALLPRHGGAGMYGLNVHRAVIQAGDAETGVSVHWVTEHFDEGGVIAQYRVPVEPSDTPETLQIRVKQVEGGFLAEVLAGLANYAGSRIDEEKSHG